MLGSEFLLRTTLLLAVSESFSWARVVPQHQIDGSLIDSIPIWPEFFPRLNLSTRLSDIQENSAGKGRGKKSARTGEGSSGKTDLTKESDSFKKDTAKGRDLYDDVLKKKMPDDMKPIPDVLADLAKLKREHKIEFRDRPAAPQNFQNKFREHGLPVGNVYTVAEVHVPHKPNYVNLIDSREGVIISRAAYKDSVNKDILFYSDFTYHTYLEVAKKVGITPRKVTRVGVEDIENKETKDIIKEALRLVGPRTTEFTFTKASHPNGFYALLAAPNLSFVPRMLAQRAHELGDHAISAVAVWVLNGEYGAVITLT